MPQSHGLLLETAKYVYFQWNGAVYRGEQEAPKSSEGYPMGSREYCALWEWPTLKQLILNKFPKSPFVGHRKGV